MLLNSFFHAWFSAEDFVYLLLLLSWMTCVDLKGRQWDLLDFFCGAGRIGALASSVGYKVASYDILIPPNPTKWRKKQTGFSARRSPMDINGESGFVFPGLRDNTCFYVCWYPHVMLSQGRMPHRSAHCPAQVGSCPLSSKPLWRGLRSLGNALLRLDRGQLWNPQAKCCKCSRGFHSNFSEESQQNGCTDWVAKIKLGLLR